MGPRFTFGFEPRSRGLESHYPNTTGSATRTRLFGSPVLVPGEQQAPSTVYTVPVTYRFCMR